MMTRSVCVQGVATSVTEAGKGLPVVLLHGIPDTVALWAPTMAGLSAHHRAIAFDLPGFGESLDGAASFDWSLANRAEFVADLLDACGIDDPVRIVAHDAGGTFAIPFVGAHPDRCAGGLFCITSLHPDFEWHELANTYRRPGDGERAMEQFTLERFTQSVRAFSGPGLTTEHIDATFARISDITKHTILRFYRSTNPSEFAPFQSAFESGIAGKPLRVIWGANNPGAGGAPARGSFPTDDFLEYPDVGHWPMIEAPDRWMTDVTAWLSF